VQSTGATSSERRNVKLEAHRGKKGNYNNKGPAIHRLHYARVGGELVQLGAVGGIYISKKIRPFKKLAVCKNCV
jgi:hypothetical protein